MGTEQLPFFIGRQPFNVYAAVGYFEAASLKPNLTILTYLVFYLKSRLTGVAGLQM
ncbi:MAG: hypothetical protein ABSF37_03455 [Sedimentisphaerales bacterium]|jgi:hypothetical protein